MSKNDKKTLLGITIVGLIGAAVGYSQIGLLGV